MDDLRDLAPVVNRVKRAQGQLAGVLRMIEEGRDLVRRHEAELRAWASAG